MTEEKITLLMVLITLALGVTIFFLARRRLKRATLLKRVVAIFGLCFLIPLFVGSVVALFLCRNFDIHSTAIGLSVAAGKHRSPLGIYAGADGYDDGVALGLARAAAITYENESKARSELEALGYASKQINYIAKGRNVGVVIVDEGSIIVAFRGTDELKDWRTNLNIVPDFSAGGVHSGFRQALDSLWEELKSTVYKEKNKRDIFLTGHSLGGAIATLAAVRMRSDGVRVAGLYTFGQPPVGGREFAGIVAAWDFGYYRFINSVDMVAAIPTVAMHAGEVRYFDVRGRLYDRQPLCERLNDSWLAPATESGAEWLTHGIERYVRLLEARM